MSEEANRQALRKYYEAANAGDVGAMLENLVPDYRVIDRGQQVVSSAEEYKAGFQAYASSFPGARFEVKHLFVEGDWGAVRLHCVFPHQGQFQGVPPTGKLIEFTSNCLYEFENGKISVCYGGDDHISMFSQLGLIEFKQSA